MDINAIIAANLDDWISRHPRLNSTDAVAKASKVGRTTIQRYRKGDGNPTVSNIADIARVFSRRPEDLLKPPKVDLPDNGVALKVAEPPTLPYSSLAIELARLADEMDDNGKWELIGTAKVLARLHPKAKRNRK